MKTYNIYICKRFQSYLYSCPQSK